MKGEKMIILRGLIPVFIAYVIYKRNGKAYGGDIKKDIERLLQKPVPRSLIYGTLKRMEKYGIIEKCKEKNKMAYKLNERGKIFLIKHVEILRYLSPIINQVIYDMDRKLTIDKSE
ncbi:helix-turn-helix transcriptional regulator [Sulfurisphaera javensis]|uniref:Helix-turn-helix transcriptional regulator n=2 Tax=Sulfurisphaera javensis TaxID=2049879 RepID=A0AAT9GT93_9CREN